MNKSTMKMVQCFLLILWLLQVAVSCGDNIAEVNVGSMALDIRPDYGKQSPFEDDGHTRTIVRVYPANKNANSREVVYERVFFNIQGEPPREQVQLELTPGEYELMVWTDYVGEDGMTPYYNADDFGEITLQGEHVGNCERRKAFKGRAQLTINEGRKNDSIVLAMEEPMAKFELYAEDLAEFASNEIARKSETYGSDSCREFCMDDYTVVIYYVGFMPNAYSMYKDRPVDSKTGVKFVSSPKKVNDTKAMLGYDYVFVSEKSSMVSVRIGVYDKYNELVALTGTITVPLNRGTTTVLSGNYLCKKMTDGVQIDPDYEGNYNLIF